MWGVQYTEVKSSRNAKSFNYKQHSNEFGTPNIVSFAPNILNCFTNRINFRQQIYRLSDWLEYIVMPFATPGQQKLLEQMFLNALNMPTIDDLKRASLVRLNIRFAVGIARLHKIWLKLVACIANKLFNCCQRMYRNPFMKRKETVQFILHLNHLQNI